MQVQSIVDTLVDVLRTPSAEVQRAVSSCLPPLMPGLASDTTYLDGLVKRLLKMLLKSKSYGDRCSSVSFPSVLHCNFMKFRMLFMLSSHSSGHLCHAE